MDTCGSAGLPQRVSYITVPGSWERRKQQSTSENQQFNALKHEPGQVVYITKGDFIAWGGTAVLERLPSGDVIKTPKPRPYYQEDYCRNMRLEAQIYERIGNHRRVPRFIQWDPDSCCLTMEYLDNGDLGEYIRRHGKELTTAHRLRWAKQAAEGLAILHCADIVHCDISPRNFLLDHDLNLKISDFGGAFLLGSEPLAVAGTRFRHPLFDWDARPTSQDDIFSLGSLIYFIMTGTYPYADRPSDEVEKLYAGRQFPDNLWSIICGSVIYSCWTGDISAQEAYSHVEECSSKL